jgi:conjugal transfer pilus assembly protein TraF
LNRACRHCLLALAVLACGSAAPADNAEKRGYWWYQKDPETPETPAADDTQAVHPDLTPPPSEVQLSAMHPKDVEKLLQGYLDYALWKMTPEHVEWYYRVQDFARRRSQAFSNVTEYVMLNNGELNMNAAYPITNPGQDARKRDQQTAISSVLDQARDRAALLLLTREGCHYCDAQRNALKYFQQQHGWEVREIDIQQHPDMKAQFSVETTPTTVIIFRGTPQWMPVSVGVDSVPTIEQNVYRAIRLLQGQTTPETFTLQENERGGVLDPQGVVK